MTHRGRTTRLGVHGLGADADFLRERAHRPGRGRADRRRCAAEAGAGRRADRPGGPHRAVEEHRARPARVPAAARRPPRVARTRRARRLRLPLPAGPGGLPRVHRGGLAGSPRRSTRSTARRTGTPVVLKRRRRLRTVAGRLPAGGRGAGQPDPGRDEPGRQGGAGRLRPGASPSSCPGRRGPSRSWATTRSSSTRTTSGPRRPRSTRRSPWPRRSARSAPSGSPPPPRPSARPAGSSPSSAPWLPARNAEPRRDRGRPCRAVPGSPVRGRGRRLMPGTLLLDSEGFSKLYLKDRTVMTLIQAAGERRTRRHHRHDHAGGGLRPGPSGPHRMGPLTNRRPRRHPRGHRPGRGPAAHPRPARAQVRDRRSGPRRAGGAVLAAVAVRARPPVTVLTSDPEDLTRLCGSMSTS